MINLREPDNKMTDDELAEWLHYIKHQGEWKSISKLRRLWAVEMAKGKRQAQLRIALLILAILTVRAALLMAGARVGEFDLILGIAIGALVLLALLS